MSLRSVSSAEIVFQEDMFTSMQPGITRRRGLSSTSQITYTSEDDNDEIMFKGSLKLPKSEPLVFPSRQPQGPPKNTLLQIDQGFARFLKEHASPPHTRVTAGGRIVPAGPRSPPPTYQMEFIDRLIKLDEESKRVNALSKDRTAQRIKQVETATLEAHSRSLAKDIFDSEMTKCAGQADSRNSTDTETAGMISGDVPKISKEQSSSTAARGPVLQLPPDAELVLMLGDGSAVISYEGAMVRAVLHGAHTFLEPLQQVQGLSSQAPPSNVQQMMPLQTAQASSYQSIPAMQQMMPLQQMTAFHPMASFQQMSLNQPVYTQTSGAGIYCSSVPVTPSVETMFHNVQGAFPVTSMANGLSGYQIQQNYQTQIDSLSTHQQTLQAHLNSLEKYVALHSHDLHPMQLSQTCAQRKNLIEQLDYIRKSRNHLEHLMQTTGQDLGNNAMYPHTGLSEFPKTNSAFRDFSEPAKRTRSNRRQNDGLKIHGSNENVQTTFTHMRDDDQETIGRKPANRNKLSPNAPAFVPGDGIALIDQRCDQSGVESLTGGVKLDLEHDLNSTAVLNPQAKPTKPYEPTVLPEDTAYCDEMGYNNPKAPKMYCSLVIEFVEAIKAAREHAKRYGCKGGQSKDPSWDAEQDIRWAMQDKIPILLPLTIPDYIQRPRPWSWDDSDFNVYRSRDPSWRPERYIRQPGEVQREPSSDRWNSKVMQESIANQWAISNRKDSWDNHTSVGSFDLAGTETLRCVNQDGVNAIAEATETDSSGFKWTPATSSGLLLDEECPLKQQWRDVQRYGHKRADSWGSDPQLSPGECAKLVLQGYFSPPVSKQEAKEWGPELTAKVNASLRFAPSVKPVAPETRSITLQSIPKGDVEKNVLRDLHDESPNPLKEKWNVSRVRSRPNGSSSCVTEM